MQHRGWARAGGGQSRVGADEVPLAGKTHSGSSELEERGQRIELAVRFGELAQASGGGVDRPRALPVLHLPTHQPTNSEVPLVRARRPLSSGGEAGWRVKRQAILSEVGRYCLWDRWLWLVAGEDERGS